MRKLLGSLALLAGIGLYGQAQAAGAVWVCDPVNLGYCANVDATGHVLTTDTGGTTSPSAAPTTNSASTITLGGTFQTIAALSTTRKSIDFQNICSVAGNCTNTTDICYLYIAASGSGSTSNSIIVQPGQEYLRASGVVPSDAISATCTTTGDKFYLAVQ